MSSKEEFINIIRSINRPGSYIDELIEMLLASDFFIAPASTKYHLAEPEGLCKHSLNVYHKLVDLVDMQYKDLPFPRFDEDSIKIVSLCHDFAKINFYEETSSNVKQYSSTGKLFDNLGRFDWVPVSGYRIKNAADRLIFGNHGQNSLKIVSNYFPLTDEESAAILWHMGGMDDNRCSDLSAIFAKYPLVSLLHTADFLSTYLDESRA